MVKLSSIQTLLYRSASKITQDKYYPYQAALRQLTHSHAPQPHLRHFQRNGRIYGIIRMLIQSGVRCQQRSHLLFCVGTTFTVKPATLLNTASSGALLSGKTVAPEVISTKTQLFLQCIQHRFDAAATIQGDFCFPVPNQFCQPLRHLQ